MGLELTHFLIAVGAPLLVYVLQKRGIVPTPAGPGGTPPPPAPPAPGPVPTDPVQVNLLVDLLKRLLDNVMKVQLHQSGVPAAEAASGPIHQVTLPLSLALTPGPISAPRAAA